MRARAIMAAAAARAAGTKPPRFADAEDEALAKANRVRQPADAARLIKADAKRHRKAEKRRSDQIAVARSRGDICDHGFTELEECERCETDRYADGDTDGARL